MKVWFFSEDWKDHNGNRRPAFYAFTEYGGHVTNGSTLTEAIYMAYDLVACCMDFEDEWPQEHHYADEKEAADEFEIPHESYLGSLNVEVELVGRRAWVRKGDARPLKEQPMRFRTLEQAFRITYRNKMIPDIER